MYAMAGVSAGAQQAAVAPSKVRAAPVLSGPPVHIPRAIVSAYISPNSALGAGGPPSAATPASAIPLAYLGAQSARDRKRAAAHTVIAPGRDYFAPCALLLVGSLLYLSYYVLRYHLGTDGILATSIGLTVMGVLECILLVGFALIVAGPLNVSFGGVGTAILKLAAIAVFCDGVTAWVDGAVVKWAGGFGQNILGFGVVGFFIAAGIYWVSLINLFDMDPEDSWMVVVILSIYYRIVRLLLVLLLLKWVLGFAGVSASSIVLPSIGGAPPPNPLVEEVNEAKEKKLLVEARQYASDNGRVAEAGLVDRWYAAACPNVWYELSRDINGHGLPYQFVVELPKDQAGRAKCYDALKQFWDTNKVYYGVSSLLDTGQPYLIARLP